MHYLPFNDEWKEEVNKLPIKIIKKLFPNPIPEDLKIKKSKLIDKLRAELIVQQFNKNFPVGIKVLWKPIAKEEIEPRIVTVKFAAYVAASGEPVAFFYEISGYCSISPEFVSNYNYVHQLTITDI